MASHNYVNEIVAVFKLNYLLLILYSVKFPHAKKRRAYCSQFFRQRSSAEAQRQNARREKDKQSLLDQQAEIRGSLRMNKWLYPILQTGFFGGLAVSALTAAAGYREPAIGAWTAAVASEAACVARWVWCARNYRTYEALDKNQELLQTRHHIFPDRGYFKRDEDKQNAIRNADRQARERRDF